MLHRLDAESHFASSPPRYELGIDSRNLDMLVGLFIDDMNVGDGRLGREAFKDWFRMILHHFETSAHIIANHEIDIESDDRATGTVYCRAEHEDNGRWVIQTMAYLDTCERREGR